MIMVQHLVHWLGARHKLTMFRVYNLWLDAKDWVAVPLIAGAFVLAIWVHNTFHMWYHVVINGALFVGSLSVLVFLFTKSWMK